MGLSYSKKVKCSGCNALVCSNHNGGIVFSCGLNVSIQTITIGRDQTQPMPLVKCWKPKNRQDYKKLRVELKKAAKNVS